MKALVICPERLAGLAFFPRKGPAALTPVLGPTLLGHALGTLREAGAREVLVLASDRPEQVRAAVGRGELWGLKVEVIAESRELSVEEARRKYRDAAPEGWLGEGADVLVADRTAGPAGGPLLSSARHWFEGIGRWLPEAHRHRVGAREIRPGIWMGLRSRVDTTAHLEAPCWLGEGVSVGARARIGPGAFVEDFSVIDHDSEVVESWVGPRTYVGAMTRIAESLAWGSGLLSWRSDSFVEVPDAFLLSSLEAGRFFENGSSLAGRAAALFFGALTLPVWLWAWSRGRQAGVPWRRLSRAVLPRHPGAPGPMREMSYWEFSALPGLWSRWPQLWSIVRGDFAWVGNRPLTRPQAAQLAGEFEELWLAAPVGLFSLADAEGCREPFGEEARTHAGFYAAQAGPRMDREILRRALSRVWGGA